MTNSDEQGSSPTPDREAVIAANIAVHSHIVERYGEEPHFRPENQAKVKARLSALRARSPGGRLLDVGCGTGFIITLAADLFDEIHGVDITPAMLAKVDLSPGNITLHTAQAEALPFDAAQFDAMTAYSFIDHLLDYRLLLAEAARVLRPGGRFYIDLIPNRAFWQSMAALGRDNSVDLPPTISREVEVALHNDERLARELGVARHDAQLLEPSKEKGGIDGDALVADALAAGFGDATLHYEWYLGQAGVLHGQSAETAEAVDRYLQSLLPFTRNLYKYCWVELIR